MDALSETSTSLDLVDLAPGPGDIVMAALWWSERPAVGADPATPPAQSMALTVPSAASPLTWADRLEQLRPAHQALILALAATVVVGIAGWLLGAAFGKAAATAATAAAL
jgi:hypothetical protein